MTIPEFTFGLGLLLIGAASLSLWYWLLERSSRGEAWIKPRFQRPVRDLPRSALILALAWIVSNLWLVATIPPGASIDDNLLLVRIRSHLLSGGLFTLLLLALTVTGIRKPTDLIRLGFRLDHWQRQVAIGCLGFLAALPLVYLMRLVTIPFQSEELVHPLLRIIQQRGVGLELWPVVVLAVVLAPLQEELLFRVLLQSALETRFTPTSAIVVSSLVFAAVHGFPDSAGIFPLAVVLGYVYQRERSFLAIVLLHSLFNGLNLVLTILQTWIGV